jgi:hypothetical protein
MKKVDKDVVNKKLGFLLWCMIFHDMHIRTEQSVACVFLSTFQGCEYSFWATSVEKKGTIGRRLDQTVK